MIWIIFKVRRDQAHGVLVGDAETVRTNPGSKPRWGKPRSAVMGGYPKGGWTHREAGIFQEKGRVWVNGVAQGGRLARDTARGYSIPYPHLWTKVPLVLFSYLKVLLVS